MESSIVQEIFIHALGFIAFFLVLKRFAFKPISQILEERRSRIEGGLQEADKTRLEMKSLKEEYEKMLEGAEAEARRKIQEAFGEGRRLAAEVQEEARVEARKILDKARRNVELEVEKARIRLRNEVVRTAVDMAEAAIRTQLSDQDHEKLVTGFIKEVAEKP